MIFRGLLCGLLLAAMPWLAGASSAAEVEKPYGLFSSSDGNAAILTHPQARGTLLRTTWASIEPSPGVFDFSSIHRQLNSVKSSGKGWSLGVLAGPTAPAWLIDQLHVPYITRGSTAGGYGPARGASRLALVWNPVVQEQLRLLAQHLAAEFKNDPQLKLVYVPQMTSNGIEGHFQGFSDQTLRSAGYTDDVWVAAEEKIARDFAAAFDNKALAIEVHDVAGSAQPAQRILTDLWNDPALNHRMGAAMWWISGKTTYQPDLLKVLMDFPGDKYGQAIGRSDQTARFPNGSYPALLAQARQLHMRYVELWEYEFRHHTFDSDFAAFNQWADAQFAPKAPASAATTRSH